MATNALSTQQLQQEILNELNTSNQLLRSITIELQQIKQFTSAGGEFEANIKQNAELMAALASIQQIDIENLLPVSHTQVNLSYIGNKNLSYEQHETFRDSSNMEDQPVSDSSEDGN